MSERNYSLPSFAQPAAPAPGYAYQGAGYGMHAATACHFHQGEMAVATCAMCHKPLCQDCYEAYGVANGEYANRALCYDCTQALVAENVEILKKNKRSIILSFALTLVGVILGLIIGGAYGKESGSVGFGMLFGAAIGGCAWTFLKNWMKRLWAGFSEGGFNLISFFIGLTLGFVIEAFSSIYRTIKKIIDSIKYLKRASDAIKSDSEAMAKMHEYMEFTQIRSQNKGVALETLLANGLSNNSFAQMVRTHGEDAATEELARATTRIASNGEVIRSYTA